MPKELRCPRTLQAVITDEGLIEIKCRHGKCGASSSVTVLHRYDPKSGTLVKTTKFRNADTMFTRQER